MGDYDFVPEAEPAGPRGDAEREFWLIGWSIRAFLRQTGMPEAELCRHLEIDTRQLGWMEMRVRPHPSSPWFLHRVSKLAHQFKCSEDALAELLQYE